MRGGLVSSCSRSAATRPSINSTAFSSGVRITYGTKGGRAETARGLAGELMYIFGGDHREPIEHVGEAEAGLEHYLLLLLPSQTLCNIFALGRVPRLEDE